MFRISSNAQSYPMTKVHFVEEVHTYSFDMILNKFM